MRPNAVSITVAMVMLIGCASQVLHSQDLALIQQSVEALQQDDWDRAEAVANVAMEINPTNGQAAYLLALVHEHHGMLTEAERMYRYIIKLDTKATVPAGIAHQGPSRKLMDIARQKLNLPETTTAKQPLNPPKDKDSDRDGIADAQDQCADTPAGAKADDVGCWTLQGLFDSGRSEIKPQVYSHLNDVVELLRQAPRMRIEIQGHTDSRGTYRHNLRLSNVRAQAVKQYLMSQGIAAKRLVATGYGPNRPMGSNDTPAGRSKNRRIEFRVLDE